MWHISLMCPIFTMEYYTDGVKWRLRMDERRIKELFQQTGETIQAILEYFRLKDKVLTTTAITSGTNRRIPNGALYHSFVFSVGGVMAYGYRDGNSIYADSGNNSTDTHVTRQVSCTNITEDGDDLVIGNFICGYMRHTASKNYAPVTVSCNKIIGIDPVIPDALQNIIGGGYCIRKTLGGGIGALIQSLKEYYSCYKQCKESNKEYKEPVLSHFEERGNGNNGYIVYGVHAERYPRRHLFGVGLHSRECWNHNDYECSNWYGRKLYEYCRRRWANYWAGRRWLPRVGNRGSFGRSRKFETCNIQILFRNDRLQREARSDQTDIEVWGCAA